MMFSLRNLGVIQSNHQITGKKTNLMYIESVFLVVFLLNIHEAFVRGTSTAKTFLYSKTGKSFLL